MKLTAKSIKVVIPIRPKSGQNIAQTLPVHAGWKVLPDPEDPKTWLDSTGTYALCVRARPHVGRTKHMFGDAEIQSVRKIGERFGCWECGAKTSGLKSGNWVCDHYPFYTDEELAKAKPPLKQVLLPHCQNCSNSQGGKSQANRGSKYAKLVVKKLGQKTVGVGIDPAKEGAEETIFICGYPGCEYEARSSKVAPTQLAALVSTHMLETHGPGSLKHGILEGCASEGGTAPQAHNQDVADSSYNDDEKGRQRVLSESLPEGGEKAWIAGIVTGPNEQNKHSENFGAKGSLNESSVREKEEIGKGTASVVDTARLLHGQQKGQSGSSTQSTNAGVGVGLVRQDDSPSVSSAFNRLPVIKHSKEHEEALVKLQKGLPGLTCSACAMSGECPEYKEGDVCYFDPLFKLLPVRDVSAHMAHIENLLEWDKERTYRALLSERLTTGGQIDPRVSAQLNDHLARLSQYEAKLRGAMPANPTASAHMKASGPGILSQLFGGAMPAHANATDEIPNEPSRTIGDETVEITITKPMP
jgi:hypothetical protein